MDDAAIPGPANRAPSEGTLRVLVADDEPLARRHLGELLREDPHVQVHESVDGLAAAETILALDPDLVLLDVAMPGLDGFEVIEAVGPERMPPVIFVTAHDDHAIRAFEVHALDYLLKPISGARFRSALEVALRHIRQRRSGDLEAALRSLLRDRGQRQHRRHCLVRRGDRLVVVDVDDVESFEAAGNYVRLSTEGGVLLFRYPLSGLEAELDAERFARIHRGAIVNVDRVRYLTRNRDQQLTVVLDSGRELPLQRRYADDVKRRLGG